MSSEKTLVDLGDDLIETTASLSVEERAKARPLTEAERADEYESARILFGEGLIDDAKKTLRRILRSDSHHVAARKLLEEIQELELKQILSGELPRWQRKLTNSEAEPELGSEPVEQTILNLDRDLGLGLVQGMSLLREAEEIKEFGEKLEMDLSGATAQDRIDIGIGFLEMGLSELAIRQFRSASKDPELLLVAASLEAQALISMGKPFEATLCLEPVLEDVDVPLHRKIDLIYLMGKAYEGLSKPEQAAFWYSQVRKMDARYRDVEERIGALRK